MNVFFDVLHERVYDGFEIFLAVQGSVLVYYFGMFAEVLQGDFVLFGKDFLQDHSFLINFVDEIIDKINLIEFNLQFVFINRINEQSFDVACCKN